MVGSPRAPAKPLFGTLHWSFQAPPENVPPIEPKPTRGGWPPLPMAAMVCIPAQAAAAKGSTPTDKPITVSRRPLRKPDQLWPLGSVMSIGSFLPYGYLFHDCGSPG